MAKFVDALVHSKGSKYITKFSSLSKHIFNHNEIDSLHRLCDEEVEYIPDPKNFMELISDN